MKAKRNVNLVSGQVLQLSVAGEKDPVVRVKLVVFPNGEKDIYITTDSDTIAFDYGLGARNEIHGVPE